jgi:hypothetical protein
MEKQRGREKENRETENRSTERQIDKEAWRLIVK